MAEALHFTGDPEADRFLAEEPLALLVGFCLDQQVTVQKAFSGPLELRRRLGSFDAVEIAAMDPAALEDVFREKPAIHRLPGLDGEARAGALRRGRGGLRRPRGAGLDGGRATARTSCAACSTFPASAR